jgi:anti-sigma B factor antagonist
VHRITVDRQRGPAIVAASGELDAFVARDLTDAFADVAADSRIVVDLHSVSFLDSTALGLVVRTVREVEERGGSIQVVVPGTTARRIFEITTLDRVLPVSESREEALRALAGQQREADAAS